MTVGGWIGLTALRALCQRGSRPVREAVGCLSHASNKGKVFIGVGLKTAEDLVETDEGE
jgi:hypothetical protein